MENFNDSQTIRRLLQELSGAKAGSRVPTSAAQRHQRYAAQISKMITTPKSRAQGRQFNKDAYLSELESGSLREIAARSSKAVSDAETIFEIFPDLALAKEILVAGVTSPSDLQETSINITLTKTLLSASITQAMLDITEGTLLSTYSFNRRTEEMVEKTLYDEGACVTIVLPESTLDDLINGTAISTESLTPLFNKRTLVSKNILGDVFGTNTQLGIESFTRKGRRRTNQVTHVGNLTREDYALLSGILPDTTDNWDVLRLPDLIHHNNKSKLDAILKRRQYSSENANLFKEKDGKFKPVVIVPDQREASRASVLRPLLKDIPVGAFIPVTRPGDVNKVEGGWVIIDSEGNPITYDVNQEFSYSSAVSEQGNQSALDLLMQKAKVNLTSPKGKMLPPAVTSMYASILETTLTKQLKNGLMGSNTDTRIDTLVAELMLSRALSGQLTRLLFIPGSMLSYITYKRNRDGTGRSLMEGIKTTASYRAINQFARTSAQLRNSIDRSKVDITYDPNDPDPDKTREIVMHEVGRNRQVMFPAGFFRPEDMNEWGRFAGIEMGFQGHPAAPELKVEVTQLQAQHVIPDETLSDDNRKLSIMGLMVNPEQVDQATGPDLATTVISNNVMVTKRVLRIQRNLMPQQTDLGKKVLLADPIYRSEMRDVLIGIKDKVAKYADDDQKQVFSKDPELFYNLLIDEFISRIVLSLPAPEQTRVETLTTELEAYIGALDLLIDKGYITSNMLDLPEIDGKMDSAAQIELVKAYFIRDWAAKRNFLPELQMIVSADEDGKPNMDITAITSDHAKALILSNVAYVRSLSAVTDAANADLQDGGGELNGATDSASEEPTDEDMSEEGGDPDGDDMADTGTEDASPVEDGGDISGWE